MFFAPALLGLTEERLGNHVKILCLSTGDADGLGKVRRKELVESAVRLGLRRKEDVFVMEDARFRDGMEEVWETGEVAGVLGEAFSPGVAAAGKSSVNGGKREVVEEGPKATIDVLVTFDGYGVSGHPNHRALCKGGELWVKNLMKGKSGWRCPVQLWSLSSVGLGRKYSGVLDAVVTMAVGACEVLYEKVVGSSGGGMGKEKGGPGRVLFVSGLVWYWKARAAMVEGHKSQMVWFRWGWITVGRYMVVNDLKRVR